MTPASFNKYLRAPFFVLQNIVFQLQNLWYSSLCKNLAYKTVKNRKKLVSISSLGGKKNSKTNEKDAEAVVHMCSVKKKFLKTS